RGNTVRVWIRAASAGGGRTLQELQDALGVEQPVVSRELAVRRAKNVVAASKAWTAVRYALRDPAGRELLAVARQIFNNQFIATQTMLRELRRETRRR